MGSRTFPVISALVVDFWRQGLFNFAVICLPGAGPNQGCLPWISPVIPALTLILSQRERGLLKGPSIGGEPGTASTRMIGKRIRGWGGTRISVRQTLRNGTLPARLPALTGMPRCDRLYRVNRRNQNSIDFCIFYQEADPLPGMYGSRRFALQWSSFP